MGWKGSSPGAGTYGIDHMWTYGIDIETVNCDVAVAASPALQGPGASCIVASVARGANLPLGS